jgi:hypothetical protein
MFWQLFLDKLDKGPEEKLTTLEQQSSSQGLRRLIGSLSSSPERGIAFFQNELRESHGRFMMWNDPVKRIHAQQSLNAVFREIFKSWISVLDVHDQELKREIDSLLTIKQQDARKMALEAEAMDHVRNTLEEEQAHRAALAEEAKKFNHG